MPTNLLLFAGFQAFVFGFVALALVALRREHRPFTVAIVAMGLPWLFSGPGFRCDHYQLADPLARLTSNPVELQGWWLAFPWCYLGVRSLYQRDGAARSGRSRVRLLLVWGLVSALVGMVGPTGDLGKRPVVMLGWFEAIALAYLGGRGLVERFVPPHRWGVALELAIAVTIGAAICIPVETFGSLAGLWHWRAHGTGHESWVYGAYTPESCPPFEPFPITAAVPFPLDEALMGWCVEHVLPPVALLLLLDVRRRRSVLAFVGGLALALSPLALIASMLLLGRKVLEAGHLSLDAARLARAEFIGNQAFHALAVVTIVLSTWRWLRNPRRPVGLAPVRSPLPGPTLLAASAALATMALCIALQLWLLRDLGRAWILVPLTLFAAALAEAGLRCPAMVIPASQGAALKPTLSSPGDRTRIGTDAMVQSGPSAPTIAASEGSAS